MINVIYSGTTYSAEPLSQGGAIVGYLLYGYGSPTGLLAVAAGSVTFPPAPASSSDTFATDAELSAALAAYTPTASLGALSTKDSIANADISADAAISWSKLSKTGAIASDVGAVFAGAAPFGLTASNNATDSNNDIDFAAGSAWCVDRVIESAGMTKRLDAAWSAGNNNGGLFSSSKAANTWYHCFILRNATTGAIDFGFDTSVTAANKPAGYDARMVWSILTDGSSNIRPFVQVGDYCAWSSPPVDVDSTAITSTASLLTLSTPSGLACRVNFDAYLGDANSDYVYFSSPLSTDVAADYLNGRISIQSGGAQFALLTNTSSQIRARGTAAIDRLIISTRGFEHPRGQW